MLQTTARDRIIRSYPYYEMFLHHYFVVVDEPSGSITPIIFESINSTTAGFSTPHDPLYEQLTVNHYYGDACRTRLSSTASCPRLRLRSHANLSFPGSAHFNSSVNSPPCVLLLECNSTRLVLAWKLQPSSACRLCENPSQLLSEPALIYGFPVYLAMTQCTCLLIGLMMHGVVSKWRCYNTFTLSTHSWVLSW
jgi:hypothetical protein